MRVGAGAPGNWAYTQVYVKLHGQDISFSCISVALKLDMMRQTLVSVCLPKFQFPFCLLFLQIAVRPCYHLYPVF